MDKKYSFSWTQPYVSMNAFFQGKECREIYEALSVEAKEKKRKAWVNAEMKKLEAIDKMDDKELTNPEAQCIIANIMKNRRLK